MGTKIISAVAIVITGFLLVTNPVVAEAAGKITGKQIKDNSVTGKDVKKNSLTGADVKEASLNGIDASTLGGVAAEGYLSRVAQVTNPASMALTPSTTVSVLGPLSLTVPTGVNFVDVSFTAGFTGNDTAMSAWFQMDGSCSTASSPGFDNRVVGDTTPSQTTLSHDMVVPVTPGVHTFRLCAFSTVGTTSQSNTLRVLTVARGSAGGTSLRPAVDSDGDIATAR